MKNIDEMQKEVFNWATEKGWHDPPPTFGEAIALLHSECSEALEEFRNQHIYAYVQMGRTSIVVNNQEYGDKKPLGVPSEFADILIRLLHYSELFGVDLQAEYEAKMQYNRTREHRHGGRAL